MNEILDRPLEPDENEPMPDDINLLFSWMTEHNVVQTLPRIDEIIAHMRKLRTAWEDKPMKDTDKPEKQIDLTKLTKPTGAPLVPVVKMRRL